MVRSSVEALSTFSIQPELRYSPSVCSAGTRTTSKRIACAAALAHADHGLRGVVQREAFPARRR